MSETVGKWKTETGRECLTCFQAATMRIAGDATQEEFLALATVVRAISLHQEERRQLSSKILEVTLGQGQAHSQFHNRRLQLALLRQGFLDGAPLSTEIQVGVGYLLLHHSSLAVATILSRLPFQREQQTWLALEMEFKEGAPCLHPQEQKTGVAGRQALGKAHARKGKQAV